MVRMAAFNFFGRLCSMLGPEEIENNYIIYEINFNLIPLILHLNDEKPSVR